MVRLAILLFALGISGLAYLYGVASTKFGLFPANVVEEAWLAAKALREAWNSDFQDRPPGAVALSSEPPILTDAGAGDIPPADEGLILMTGAPDVLTTHCPELGCLAWLMDRSGKIYHVWPIDPAIDWGETLSGFNSIENIIPHGSHVFDNGDLLVSFQGRNTFPFGVGLAKFDKDGQLLWKSESNVHHWFDIDEEGNIFTPAHRLIDSPLQIGVMERELVCADKKIYDDLVEVFAQDGEVLEQFSLTEVMIDSGYGSLLELTRNDCDPLHLNDVEVLDAADAAAYPRFAAGDLLVSINSLNAIAVLDGTTKQVKWLISGMMSYQHNPRFSGDNKILVFDNRAGEARQGGSRLVEIDVGTHEFEAIFPHEATPDEIDFYTSVAGHFDMNEERDRALVSLSLQGRVLEIDLEAGEVLWEFENVHDVARYLEAEGKEADTDYAIFGITGAYYAGVPAFLESAGRTQQASDS
ncbi:MAG: arylsulfotransferase family protein [Pseudomonadota bacterium]